MATVSLFSTASNPLALSRAAQSQASGTSSGSSSESSATISANDFLTLLVTEMKNQDPTANTDPSEYISQLVQVNSLEQLIGINQTLTSSLGSGSTSGTSGQASSSPVTETAAVSSASNLVAPASTPGNLGLPPADPSALDVAHALDGKVRNIHTVIQSRLR